MVDKQTQEAESSVLHRIFASRKEDLAELNANSEWHAAIRDESTWPQQPPRRFRAAFDPETLGLQYRVIAEVKRASPSKGTFASHHDPVDVAKSYSAHGATALSVLTEPKYFGGSVSYIKDIRAQLPDMPILMKDFFFDDSQVYQARSIGADAILLIAAYLSEQRLDELYRLAHSLGLTTLVEVHDRAELDKIPVPGVLPVEERSLMVGVNTRDLRDLSISLDRFAPLAQSFAQHPSREQDRTLPLIAESGINETNDLALLAGKGAKGFLVGSSLMATDDPGKALAQLMGSMQVTS